MHRKDEILAKVIEKAGQNYGVFCLRCCCLAVLTSDFRGLSQYGLLHLGQTAGGASMSRGNH
jgi:hypothetical protein